MPDWISCETNSQKQEMKIFILTVIGLAACSVVVSADPAWNDLRGSFLIAKDESFARFPRTVRETLFSTESWNPTSSTPNDCTNGGLFNGIQYVKNNDYSVGLLYDVNGVIAGIQILFLQATVLTSNNNLQYGDIAMYNNATYNGQQYFVITAYFVDPSTICTSGRLENSLQSVGTGTGLWIQNGPSAANTISVPFNRPDATASGWTENNCFPAMGYHNFRRLDQYTETNCRIMSPVFGLYNTNDKLHGFGFITVGNVTNPRFEHPPASAIKMILGKDKTPQCVLDIEATEGVFSLHVYFRDSPWLIYCSPLKWFNYYLNATSSWLTSWG